MTGSRTTDGLSPRESKRAAARLGRSLIARQDLGWLLVLPFSIFTLQHLFRSGFPPGFDMALHFYRVPELVHCWRDGVFYPRWAPNLVFGLGYPLFNFYAPLLYYIVGLLHLAGLSVEIGLKVVIGASLVGGGLGMYLLAREWLGVRAAILASVAFTYAPFRLREISMEGDYAQLMGLALMPLLFWSWGGGGICSVLRCFMGGYCSPITSLRSWLSLWLLPTGCSSSMFFPAPGSVLCRRQWLWWWVRGWRLSSGCLRSWSSIWCNWIL